MKKLESARQQADKASMSAAADQVQASSDQQHDDNLKAKQQQAEAHMTDLVSQLGKARAGRLSLLALLVRKY